MTEFPYLEGLNPGQRQAVENTEGAALVIAGAGSGKTRVLTYRIAHLLNIGKKPYTILSLTFTNKAAKEMKMRIAEVVGEKTAQQIWMGTFHSIFAKILRYEAEHLGYPSSFTIYDTADSKSIIKNIIKQMQLDDHVYKPNTVLGRISSAKNDLVTPQAYSSSSRQAQIDASMRMPAIGAIYLEYAKRCKKSGAMDFDDILLQTNILFKNKPEVLAKYQDKFKYILVDEYQDTNYSQYLIIKRLAEISKNICVVGDDAQSIYAFRGAKIENILNFRNDYPDYQLYKLEQNYRSTQNIVNAANSVIDKNRNQIKKNVFSENESGSPIKIVQTQTDNEEAYVVASSIMDTRLSEHYNYSDFAILYRTNAQSRAFEEALRKRNIPYKISGGMSFYERKEIKDVLAYCRLVINPNDTEALKRIINYPKRGIGLTSVSKIEALANQLDLPMWNIVYNVDKVPDINTGTKNKIKQFAELITVFMREKNQMDAHDMAHKIASDTGILKDLYDITVPENISKHENVQELLNAIKDFTMQEDLEPEELTLDKFMEEVALYTNEEMDKSDADRVNLMTVHSSKGLEFKNVYIAGMEEELFPSKRSVESESDIEEERRLFYVAITRAKKQVMLSNAKFRYKWGEMIVTSPSRFLDEIDAQFLDENTSVAASSPNTSGFVAPKKPTIDKTPPAFKQSKFKKVNNSTGTNPDNFTSNTTANYKIGQKVEHQRFGFGEIEDIEGNFPNTKLKIKFQKTGTKTILLKFAKLRLIQ